MSAERVVTLLHQGTGTWVTSYPKQVGEARLMPLTPELRSHYACAPGTCDHPLCQP